MENNSCITRIPKNSTNLSKSITDVINNFNDGSLKLYEIMIAINLTVANISANFDYSKAIEFLNDFREMSKILPFALLNEYKKEKDNEGNL